MKIEDATVFTEKCFNGEPASCTLSCPFRLDVRAFLAKMEQGKWRQAYKAFRTAAVFPVIVSALCPEPCAAVCRRAAAGDEAVSVRALEDACIRLCEKRKPESYVIPPKTGRIAVVGAGPAGLSCAFCLAQKRFVVTVFEKNEGWGGRLRAHPRFEKFNDDISLQFSAVEAEFKFNTEIESLGELSGFDAVYVATGAGGSGFGLLSGWDANLLSTAEPKVFMGGSLTGADTVSGIAQGVSASVSIEVFLQTGKASETYGAKSSSSRARDIGHTGVPGVSRVIASSPDEGYNEEEAKAEAARCLKCDCERCMTSCEMLASFRKKPKKIAMEVYADTQVHPPLSTHTLTKEAYSCNMCGHCKQICPESVDIGALLQASRAERVKSGEYPEVLHDYWLREMDFSVGEASFFMPPPNRDSCKYAFFPGCQLGAHNPEHVFRSYDFLAGKYDAGIFTHCCGAPAYWAGDTERWKVNLKRIKDTWRELGEPRFVFACATCESLFNAFLPEIPRVSLYELLSLSDDLNPALVYGTAHVFDPCNARGDENMQKAARELSRKSGTELRELPEKNRCCGYGGHIRIANPTLYDAVTANRADAGSAPYIVYCANCREVFISRGKECAHILDIAFNLPDSGRVPAIGEKRHNSLSIKRDLLKKNSGIDFNPETHEWDNLRLVMDDELAENVDRKLISFSDIKEAIWLAEKTGDKFIDETSGVCQCSMEKPALTYWVQYKEAGGGEYEVYGAYYHRIRFSREEA